MLKEVNWQFSVRNIRIYLYMRAYLPLKIEVRFGGTNFKT